MLEKLLRFFERHVIPRPLYRLGQPFYHFLLAFLGNLFYGAPSKKVKVIGVTGTKGKTTTLELINAILAAAQIKTVLLSSVRTKTGSMPGRFAIQRLLRKAVKAGCSYALIEVTSEGIVQHRHRFIEWDAAIFLNLQPEHIEAHGSFEEYREAKLDFFRYVARSPKPRVYFLINRVDPNVSYFERIAHEARHGLVAFFSGTEFMKSNIYYYLKNEWLKNDFNLENAAAAVAFARSQGIKNSVIEKALEDFKGVPGRLEFVQREPFAVVVDYAHTPDSLEKVYKTLKAKNHKLVCVLGSAGGGRDKWKRPIMGKIAAEYCQIVILTSEDPYDENPETILDEIESGFSQIRNSKFEIRNFYKITDRRQALEKAVSLAEGSDVVIATGMGSQSWFYGPRGRKLPWGEKKILEEILKGHGQI